MNLVSLARPPMCTVCQRGALNTGNTALLAGNAYVGNALAIALSHGTRHNTCHSLYAYWVLHQVNRGGGSSLSAICPLTRHAQARNTLNCGGGCTL